MEKILYKKQCGSNCHAILKTIRIFENNRQDQYMGRCQFFENGINLFNIDSNIIRLTLEDAFKDAEDIAIDNGF